MRIPSSTYRLQLNAEFTFADAREALGYLARLGVTDLYLSPICATRAGSGHGYDVVDPTRIDPERGGREGFEELSAELRDRGMGLLLDIVPNHMAAHAQNPWWMDVLRHGAASYYAEFFDVDWAAGDGRIRLPVLGSPYAEVLEAGELRVEMSWQGIRVRYHDRVFPIDPTTLASVLRTWLQAGRGPAMAVLGAIADLAEHIPARTVARRRERLRRREASAELDRQLVGAWSQDPARRAIERGLDRLNGRPGDPASFDDLDALLEAQPYRLTHWRTAGREMSYRRFFDITDLVSLRAEEPRVFEQVHHLALDLARRGSVTGLRIDHIDGLRDPQGYLERLQDALGEEEFYVVVEKILERSEQLPARWPVAGTTGYEFADHAGAVLADPKGATALDDAGAKFCGSAATFADCVSQKKRYVLDALFAGEVWALSSRVGAVATRYRTGRDLTAEAIRRALVELTVALDVYRTYIRGPEVSPEDRQRIEEAVGRARNNLPADDAAALDFLRSLLLGELPDAADHLDIIMRWQQLTSPAMAKGFEDTALYAFPRFVSRNDVGGDPGEPAIPPDRLHAFLRRRSRRWPYSLNATSTHDSKRGEDVRARIDVLSEVPEKWWEHVHSWRRAHARFKTTLSGEPVPTPAEELLVYQTVLGAWPLGRSGRRQFRDRVERYVVKAAREAKEHTSWRDPDEEHEHALTAFVRRILAPSNRPLIDDLDRFGRTVAFHGALNSLAQLVAKLAAPGVPDLYQGSELWTLTLVDPDNRGRVDFRRRDRLLSRIDRRAADAALAELASDLFRTWEDGTVKLFVTTRGLRLRADHPTLFAHGSYRPLTTRGRRADHVLAFLRRRGRSWLVAAVPRLTVGIGGFGSAPLGRDAWGSGRLQLPAGAPTVWTNVFTGEELRLRATGSSLGLADVFGRFPVALLHARKEGR